MKIVGKVARDYYDSCTAYGVDETQILIRNPECITLGRYDGRWGVKRSTLLNICSWTPLYQKDVHRYLMFFCGTTYNLYTRNDGIFKYSVSGEMLEDYKEERLFGERVDNFTIPQHIQKELEEYSHKLKCPYFILNVEDREVCINTWPVLSDYQFQQAVDPYTAYQEIEQYMFGVLGGHSGGVVEISDKSKLTKHGFDSKLSFRRGKSK